MFATSRFGSQGVGASPRTVDARQDEVNGHIYTLVNELATKEMGTLRETIKDEVMVYVSTSVKDLVEKELLPLDNKIRNIIDNMNVLTSKPNVIDVGNRRVINIKAPVNGADAVTLDSLPYKKDSNSTSLQFGSYRLLSTATPQSPQDFATVAYLKANYEPKKKTGRGGS